MTCSYCREWNSEDEDRCRKCGRRLAVESPHRTTGALATAPAPRPASPVYPAVDNTGQGLLFAEKNPPKVIPFQSFAPSRIEPMPPKPAAKPAARKRPADSQRLDDQGMLDFLPPIPPAPRTLKTKVEAVIYCDAPVASSTHRCLAALLDWSMIAIACGLFLFVFQLCGGDLLLNRVTAITFSAAFIVVALFYGFLWLLANTETPGMRWVHLQLTNFDGLPPDRIHRALRFGGTCLSLSAAGLGILWALLDEETLTWQDHISKTFPTIREAETSFFRR